MLIPIHIPIQFVYRNTYQGICQKCLYVFHTVW